MSIQLYPFQQQAVSDLREAYREHTRILLVAPTGSGKSVMFSHIIAATVAKGKRVLCLSDRVEIFEQNTKHIAKHNIAICKVSAKSTAIYRDAMLFVGMVETFNRRIKQFASIKFDLIVLDEGHKSCYFKVLDAYPNTKTLSCTATPKNPKLHLYYTKIVQSIDIPELIDQGFLSPCKGYAMQDDFSDLVAGGEDGITEKSNFAHFNKSKLYQGCVEQWRKVADGKRTIVFCINIAHSVETTKAFNEAGIKAYCVHSKTPEAERNWVISEHRRGAFPVLINSNVLVAGYDDPAIECIVFNRATGSLPFWLQGCGRGSRIMPGKRHFIVLDLGGNFERHGLWEAARIWRLTPPPKRAPGSGVAPIKSCKNCQAILPASARVCQYCGCEMPLTEKELAAGRLVEVQNRLRAGIEGKYVSMLTIPELIEMEKTGQFKASYVWRILRSRGKNHIEEYARIKDFKWKWIMRQLEAMEAETADGKKIQFNDLRINEVVRVPRPV